MKKSVLFFIYPILFMLSASCEDNMGTTSGNNKEFSAPENPSGREFVFYPDRDSDWQFKVMPGETPDMAAISTNSSSTYILEPYCYYDKVSSSTVSISFNFISYINLNGTPIGQFREYDLILVFKAQDQGTFTGTVSYGSIGELNTRQISGMFSYDTDRKPDWENATDIPEINEEDNIVFSTALGVQINSISASDNFRRHSISVSLIVNDRTDLPDKIGYCLGTSPGVTLETALITRNESETPFNGYSNIIGGYANEAGILKSGTTYYIRPYHKVEDKVTYYSETPVETLGGEITLDLQNNLVHIFNFVYNIKKKGSYSFSARFRVHGANGDFFYTKEYGTREEGSGSIQINMDDIPYDWNQIHVISGSVKDLDTGITYSVPSIDGGAGDSCL